MAHYLKILMLQILFGIAGEICPANVFLLLTILAYLKLSKHRETSLTSLIEIYHTHHTVQHTTRLHL